MEGRQFMATLLEEIEDTEAGDFIYAHAWDLNADVLLNPEKKLKEGGGSSELFNVLREAARRNATVHILLSLNAQTNNMMSAAQGDVLNSWRFLWFEKTASAHGTCKKINEAVGKGDACVVDWRHGHLVRGGNHAKFWLVRRKDSLTAILGGIDVTKCRWDTEEHAPGDHEVGRNLEPPCPTYWHDSMYMVHGHAAVDVLNTFYQLWNDPVRPMPQGDPLPQLPRWQPPADKLNVGDVDIQVVRTLSCVATSMEDKGGGDGLGAAGMRARRIFSGLSSYVPFASTMRKFPPLWQTFAPHGEFSYAAAWFKAVRQATDYIYVVDPLSWYDEALDALVDAAERVRFIVIVSNPGLDIFNSKVFDGRLSPYQVQQLWAKLEERGKKRSYQATVKMYWLQGPKDAKHPGGLYVHEKGLLVDDEYALVGSMCVERTGFTNDLDVGVGVHSPTEVRRLREGMWAHLLQTSPDNPDLHELVTGSPRPSSASLRLWQDCAARTGCRVREFRNDELAWKSPLAAIVYNGVETDGRCGSGYKDMWEAAKNGISEA